MITLMSGKVALVTGGSSGIGQAAAQAFAQQGAQVVIASRNPVPGEAAAQSIRAAGALADWIQCDVSQAAQVKGLVEEIVRRYNRLDYAFNNAGSGGRGGWLADLEEEDWDKTIDGYLKSVWLCMKYEINQMLSQGGGVIVNNSSVDGLRAFPWDPAYSAAKHGVLGMTKSAAVQYIQKGVRINAVCPGWIATPATDEMFKDPKTAQAALMHQPIGRVGKAAEVADVVVWLCSEASSLVVGTAFPVDGGYTAV